VDRATRAITHIAVVEKSLFHGEERLVPVDKVLKTSRDEVHLSCTGQDVLQMESFTRTSYLEIDQGVDGYAYSAPYTTMYPEMGMSPGYVPTVQDYLVPEGGVAVQRGMAVEALDGYAGQVGELLIDPETKKVTHFLLMKGHGWGKKEVAIQLASIDRVASETIYLKISKEQVGQLPSLPVKRTWDEVVATELELMVWVFDQKDRAEKAYQQVLELRKHYALDVLNATLIEKTEKGEIHLHEVKKVPTKRKVTLGIALGGLAGMLVGPVALVAGVVAGAMAGRKSARKIEVGFSEDKLRKLNDSLPSGGSALVLLVEHRWFTTLQLELAEQGGQLIHERLADVTFDQLVGQLPDSEKPGEES
jgi:uncharacterized membrane protein